MRILDRYILKNFLANFLLALGVLVGMFVLLDLIINFDRFAKGANNAGETGVVNLLLDILDYYGYQMLVIFQLVAGVVPLLAAGFTMVRMTRHSELTAMLSSGVSLYRVAAPIVLVSIAFTALAIIDQELLMPRFQDKLLRRHEDVNRVATDRAQPLYFVQDQYNLVLASDYDKENKVMRNVRIIERDKDGNVVRRSMANTATWDPQLAQGDIPGGWRLEGDARLIDDRMKDPEGRFAGVVPRLDYQTGLEPRHIDLVLSKRAVEFLSSGQVRELILNSPRATKPSLEKIMHTRFTQPVVNIIMLLLGIPFLLTREPGKLIKNIFYCIIVAGICFAGTFICFQMGGNVISPLLAAWLPVLIFGPISLVALDFIRT